MMKEDFDLLTGEYTEVKEGYPVRNYGRPAKRYCRTLELADSPRLISLYRACHSREKHWKEVRDGIREVGILEMEMYIHENKVFMIVDTIEDFDWDEAMARLATLPRQAEWEAYVAQMQGCDPEASSDQKWHLMERMFHLYDA